MTLEEAIEKRERIRKKAEELENWYSAQENRAVEHRDHVLLMPVCPQVKMKIKKAIGEYWETFNVLDEKITAITNSIDFTE